jgi:hypothetical protein
MSTPKLYHPAAAAYLRITTSTWRDYTSSRGGRPPRGPAPDGVDIVSGHARPYWYVATLDEWAANRPGQGKGGGRKASASA